MPRTESPVIESVIKRDGTIVSFERTKIENAIAKALEATGEGSREQSKVIAESVVNSLSNTLRADARTIPSVEEVQDSVETELMKAGFGATAKAYILYRVHHAKLREASSEVSPSIRAIVAESKKYFSNQLSEFVYYSTYSRWLDDAGRREAWVETVNRYVAFMRENLGDTLLENEYAEIRENMLAMKAMGSMRL
ncbi:ribonucleoside-triphosphate reductase, partial [Patescibacteria group bacterium]|nr:ribonucleoside-triphosphate reductase [Patescibacteria group bacterium]